MDPSPYLGDMKRWAKRFLRDAARADDLVQDTCVKLLRLQFDPKRGMKERSFAYLVMRSAWLANLDSARRLKRKDNDALTLIATSSPPRQENMIYVCELVKRARSLPRGQQIALGKTIAGDELTHSERTMLGNARKAFGKAPMVSKRRTR